MQARYHITSGGIGAALLFPVLGINSIFFWAASVLIDGDHYLDYLFRNGMRNFSIRKMFIFHDLLFPRAKGRDFLGVNLMHTAEFLLVLYAASVLTGWLWLKAILWGMLFHMLVDLTYLAVRGRMFRRSISLIEYIIRWKRLQRQGLRPEEPYQSVLRDMGLPAGSSDSQPGQANHEYK